MQKSLGMKLAILIMSLTVALTFSCQKKTVAVDNGSNSTARSESYDSSEVDQSNMEEKTLYSSTTDVGGDSGMVLQKNIFFEYDRATLTPEARETLVVNGKWLRENSDVMITIEGHCDERGTNDYNLALGDRRAESVKMFLVDLGIDRSRLTTVSFGEERPLDHGHGEAAWAKNRRAYFLIK